MIRAFAIAALALASCRSEVTIESAPPRPLEPSGEPVAQAPRHRQRETRDDRTADTRGRRDDRAKDTLDREVPPPPPPAIEDELPPSLYEANRGGPPKGERKERKQHKDKHDHDRKEPPPVTTTNRIAPIKAALCVTTGVASIGAKVEKAAMRAVAKGTDGDVASMTFTFEGETKSQKKLASGELRRQLGLKLRAENGCNLIYVMWRLDPKPMIYAQVKRNPGAKDHKACGTSGYKKIKAAEDRPPPELRVGDKHTLRAEIDADVLKVFIDDTLYWRGTLPDAARDLRGPAGLRSDNLAFDLLSFDAATTDVQVGNAKCVAEDND